MDFDATVQDFVVQTCSSPVAGVKLINSEVLLPVMNSHELACLVCQKHGVNDVLIGTSHKQPALDTNVYMVHFPYGHSKELITNAMADVLYAQCDGDCNEYALLNSIVDYRCNINVSISCHNLVKVLDEKEVVTHST